MNIFFFKSVLSLLITASALAALFTMFEIYGRDNRKYSTQRLIRTHRVNGVLFSVIFLFVSSLCLYVILEQKAELSSRGTFHSVFALTVIILMCAKITCVRIYRKYYEYAKTFGLFIALSTFLMAGISGGYYLLVTEFGTEQNNKYTAQLLAMGWGNESVKEESGAPAIADDRESIENGKEIFKSRCAFCHRTRSTETMVGPGLKGILRRSELPVSGREATSENIRRQLMKPVKNMPSFEYLSEAEIEDLLAYLNTL